MKIICIGRNYRAHAAELKNEVPSEPVIFLKPPTALHPTDTSIQLPGFSKDIHHEIELVLRVATLIPMGGQVPSKGIYDMATVGLDLTAREMQSALKDAGLPWEKAKAFDGSAVLGEFITVEGIDMANCSIRLQKNGKVVQEGNTKDLIFPINTLASHITRFTTLEPGDLIFTGTPSGVGPIASGDQLSAELNDQELLKVAVA